MTFENTSREALRDRFAEAAMHALLSNDAEMTRIATQVAAGSASVKDLPAIMAKVYYQIADAMLSERDKPK